MKPGGGMKDYFHQPRVSSGAYFLKSMGTIQRRRSGAGQISRQAPGSLVHLTIAMPARLVERMEHSSAPEETGLEIALELIEQVRRLQGVSGIHLMSIGWESILPRLLREANLSNHVRTGQL